MIIKVVYCKHIRKDGTCNQVVFDIDKKVLLNDIHENFTFVEAAVSKDVDNLREALIKDGYDHTWLK